MYISNHYRGRRVLVTGHTGFKGGWLVTWLARMGAEVTGYSDAIPTQPSLFDVIEVGESCSHVLGDINDLESLKDVVQAGQFHTVFHLAAQPLVRHSYADPLGTLSTNVIGTANVLEAIRSAEHPCSVVVVTSDKCYENDGSLWGFRETDPMGGSDPYSMSKGAAELVVASWRRSFFAGEDCAIRVASARAGNVIGGGDWATDRIVPDCIVALEAGKSISVRNPNATRPWQHVVEPLSGYLLLGAMLSGESGTSCPSDLDSGWNFGPHATDVRTVIDLVEGVVAEWGRGAWENSNRAHDLKEAATLGLNCEKAAVHLGWQPAWAFDRAVSETASWYKRFYTDGPSAMREFTLEQIAAYEACSSLFAGSKGPASDGD